MRVWDILGIFKGFLKFSRILLHFVEVLPLWREGLVGVIFRFSRMSLEENIVLIEALERVWKGLGTYFFKRFKRIS